jgi:hypothetical protein
MRYRRLDSDGDMTFGHGQANFLINSPACVGQSVLTRLRLLVGEWFLDTADGTPWRTQILSATIKNTIPLYDRAIRQRVLLTAGVTGIAQYSSNLDNISRKLTVSMTIDTIYGQATISAVL